MTGKPGETLKATLWGLRPADRPLFLQFLEAKARQSGDLEFLREIKAYKASQLSTQQPPKDSA